MRKALFATVALAALSVPAVAMAKDVVVGVSWSNFQEERWKTDEAAIKAGLAETGAKYISADAQANPTKQLADVESLISKGANCSRHSGDGQPGDSAGDQEGDRRRHPGHRL